jgi:hypothetical protein
MHERARRVRREPALARSLVATITFMATGALTIFLLRSVAGGTP